MTGPYDDWLGRTQTAYDALTPALVRRYRATLDIDAKGSDVPNGMHWCLCLPDAPTAHLDHDGHPKRGDFLPPIPLPRRMWAGSDVHFLSPLHSGAAISRVSRVRAITPKTGSSGPLVLVEILHETLCDGVLSVTEKQTLVYREAANGAAPPTDTEPFDPDPWTFHRSLTPAAPLLFRYSALTFNSHRIHYDLPYARDVEGYRGLVVHGPLLASLLLQAAAQASRGAPIAHFSFRAKSPAFAGEPLHLVAREEDGGVMLAAYNDSGVLLVQAQASTDPMQPA